MIIINNVIVNAEIINEKFSCELSACKGACCWEGDYGAPLSADEIEILEQDAEKIKPYLESNALEKIQESGASVYFKEAKFTGTNLLEDGSCVYLNRSSGIALCGIEQAWKDNKTALRKPISCHLYPIRIEQNHITGFETLNYDEWDICSAACVKGEREKIRVFEFAKEALIRKYGAEFYNQLDAASKNY